MTDRKRLIELINKAESICDNTLDCDSCKFELSGSCKSALIADYLLANDVIVPPCKVGDRLFCVFTDRGINKTYTHIEACKVINIVYFDSNNFVVGVREINKHYSHNVVLGKDAFKTFEEAEEKLKEREG